MPLIVCQGVVKKLVWVSALALGLSAFPVSGAAAAQNGSGPCPPRATRIACVDLTHQTMWVQSRGKVIWGPVHIRSGARRTPTRTGLKYIFRRVRIHTSSIDGESMPYSQFFDRGEALHGTTTALSAPPGSLGCVTMKVSDAASLWNVTRMGDPVYVWGHRPSP
jgi:lipoprotein-anchoring transpeptidase ErfK/SrfK